MAKNTNTNTNATTVADVVAQATEEKLVTATVPHQTENEKTNTPAEETASDAQDSGVCDEHTPKKTVGQRLDAGIAKLKENKKVVLGVVAAVGVAAVAFAKFAKKQVDEAIVEDVTSEETEAGADETSDNTETDA